MTDKTEYCTFDELIGDIDPELRSIFTALRDIITSLHKEYVEVCWKKQRIVSYGVGPKKMSEHYVYIALLKERVNLGFYYGTSLSDPGGLLEGTGKNLRHIKIQSVSEAARPEVKNLIAEAVEERMNVLS